MTFDEINRLNQLLAEKDKEILKINQMLEEERSESKGSIQKLKDFYESILTLMPGHVYWLDKDNVYLGCNALQAKNAGLDSYKDIVGKTNYDLPWKDQAEELNNLNTRVMETGIPHTAEEYAVMADGTSVYFSNKTPIRDKENNTIGLLGVSIDITEQKKLEVALKLAKEQAEAASQIKNEFIANLSHDLRIPLSGVMELAYVLGQQVMPGDEKQKATWISDSCKQLLKILDNSFILATKDKIQESEVDLQAFALRQCLQEISQLMYPKIKLNNIELEIEVDSNLPELFITDAVKLHRILLTLLINAINQTESGFIKIKVSLLSQDAVYAQVLFSITDSGSKVPIEIQSSLLNGLMNADTDSDQSLHLAQKYLSLLGGEIGVKSEEKQGSTYYFTLSMKIA